ncbi:OmpA family protein [Acidithiobacillus sp. IBUN Pt1247-S3]|uniref:OmpA family protein n=1 Tax=Acidithiobacillus sp. IBUN Pt1247-S3 TaxID=3166642 RepID=UPI0034E51D2B
MPQFPSSTLSTRAVALGAVFSTTILLSACAQHVSPTSHAQMVPSSVVPSQSANTQALNRAEERENNLSYGPLGGHNENLSDAELAALPRHLRVHFAQNSFHISAHARHITNENARFLRRFPNLHVRLEGNCSQPGTQEYNLGLGEWRAHAIKELLEADGVSASRISTVSFGKDNLLCNQNTAACWHRNQRVDFVYRATSSGE